MPELVRNFSEGLIDEYRYSFLNKILASWLKSVAKKQYLIKSNPNTTETPKSEAELERLDKNFNRFVQRVLCDGQGERSQH